MKEKTNLVQPGYVDYVEERLGITETDSDQFADRSEGSFESRADMREGVSGLAAADTTYENTSESIVQKPKSDWDDNISLRGKRVKDSTVRHPAPYPMDLGRYPQRRV
jgi:hypothetical protein